MEELTTYESDQLPDTLADLTQFVLVGKAKLNAYMIKLQAVNKLSVAQEIRDQTLKEAQEISTALIAAEQRIGELLLAIPKAAGGDRKSEDFKKDTDVQFDKSKSETIKELGYSERESKDYQTMAKNPEVVQRVIDAALANGDVVTKTQVLKEIKAAREEAKREAEKAKQDELERLMDRVEFLEAKEPEIVEVIPNDYEKLKSDVEGLRRRMAQADKERIKVNGQLNEAQKKIREYENRKDILEMQKKLEEEAGYFTIRTYDYIQKHGGYVWITERLNDLPDGKRKEFIASVYAIDAFAKQMIENIGGYGIE